MAYSTSGRKPMERASKISHAEVINNSAVKSFVKRCVLPPTTAPASLGSLLEKCPDDQTHNVRAVIAIDGGYTETPVQQEYPYAAIAFYTFGPLLFELEHLSGLDQQRFISPADIQKLKRLQRYNFVLPLRGIRLEGEKSLSGTVRRAVYEFFVEERGPDKEQLIETLSWFLFRRWESEPDDSREENIRWCPNKSCTQQDLVFRYGAGWEVNCPSCGVPVFLTDMFRFDERVDEEQGADAIVGYVMTLLEQIVLVHLLKSVLSLKPGLLKEILFIKDGPLAFFGVVAPLYKPMRELTSFLLHGANGDGSMLNLVGLEKSGAFVEHAFTVKDSMPPGTALLCSNDYIYTHIIPGDPLTSLYGSNTYYGQKVIYRSASGEMYVVTIPSEEYGAAPKVEDIPGLFKILSILGRLRCSMYENALLPIALVNKLVSLSDFPSQRILATFAQSHMTQLDT